MSAQVVAGKARKIREISRSGAKREEKGLNGGSEDSPDWAGEGRHMLSVPSQAAGSRGTVRKGEHHLLPVGPQHRGGHGCGVTTYRDLPHLQET